MRIPVPTVVALMASAALATSAAAQVPSPMQGPMQGPMSPYIEPTPPPPIAPPDMPNYCVYENRVYSLGSGLCLGRTAYVCVPTPGPPTGNRAYWTSKEDQIFLRPQCI
jgi:hypothetical protein